MVNICTGTAQRFFIHVPALLKNVGVADWQPKKTIVVKHEQELTKK